MLENEINISENDKYTIQQIVNSFPSGERVRAVRNCFKSNCTYSHFLYLGIIIGGLVNPEIKDIHKLKILSYLN